MQLNIKLIRRLYIYIGQKYIEMIKIRSLLFFYSTFYNNKYQRSTRANSLTNYPVIFVGESNCLFIYLITI